MALSLSRIVDVSVSISPLAQQGLGFGLLNAIGISTNIPLGERFIKANDIDGVANYFATTDEEYKLAQVYFSQIPRPNEIMISRRADVASPAELVGGANTTQTIATWTAISDGAFDVDIDTVEENVTGCDFSSVTDMDDVAAVIDAQFTGSVVWDSNNTRFVLTTASTGAATSIGFANAPATGTDISGLMDAQTGGGAKVYDGVDAETITESLQAIQDATDASTASSQDWYGFAFTKEVRDDQDSQDAAGWAEARTKMFVNCSSDANGLVTGNETNIGHILKTAGYNRTMSQIDKNDDYACVSAFGRHSTVDFDATNSTITLKFKQQPGITPENLTASQADAAINNNLNYYTYFADSAMLAEGVVANGRFVDEVIGLDALESELQVAVFNALYQSTTKIPQTNAGVSVLVQKCEEVLDRFVNNGLLAPGNVTIDNITTFLEKGYRVIAQRVEDQSQSDREARKAPPIAIVAKGAGALHSVTINVTFVR